jgi:hypothetical protein
MQNGKDQTERIACKMYPINVPVETITELVNLTPHAINLLRFGTLPACSEPARASFDRRIIRRMMVADFPTPVALTTVGYTGVVNLPDPIDGVFYIVSALVMRALRELGVDRDDVGTPDALQRSDDGSQVRACKYLCTD